MSDPKSLHKETIVAPLSTEMASLLEAASALDIPPASQRQPDLQYLTAIFVSSGMNKNGAVFLGSELVKARGSISTKAVDIEHNEQEIVGHITNSAFLARDGDKFDPDMAAKELSVVAMDEQEMDVAISAVIHKTRFPDLASEIEEGEWMVSMEAFYQDFDIKVGDLIIPRDEATELGYDKLVGEKVKVVKGKEELGFHLVGRVLRGIIFAGVGLVKNPANERSIIMEAAALNEYVDSMPKEGAKIVNVADVKNLEINIDPEAAGSNGAPNGKSPIGKDVLDAFREAINKIDILSDNLEKVSKQLVDHKDEQAGIDHNKMTPGTCVSFRKYVYENAGPNNDDLQDPAVNEPPPEEGRPTTQFPLAVQPGAPLTEGPDARVVRENYCSLFDLDCTARPGDATHPDCWRNVFARAVTDEVKDYEDVLRRRRASEGLVSLQELIDSARDFVN